MILIILLGCSFSIALSSVVLIISVVYLFRSSFKYNATKHRFEKKKDEWEELLDDYPIKDNPIMDDLMRIMTYTGADDHE